MEIMELRTLAGKVFSQFKKNPFGIAVKNIIYQFITRERSASYGPENPDKTIYIIRSLAEKSPYYIGPVHNLLANYFYVVSHLWYAEEKGWTPVVDQLNYPVYNSQAEPVNGSANPWEYFWEQPGGISLMEAYRSKNVVLSKQSWFWRHDLGYDVANYYDNDFVQTCSRLASSACLNRNTEEYINAAKDKLFADRCKTLGVNVRLGGHAKQSIVPGKGHPIQPEVEELISIVQDRCERWHMDRVLLASDSEMAVDAFRAAFGDKLLVFERMRAEKGKEYLLDSQKGMYAKGHSYQTALDYLCEMELLSDCDALIGSVTSGLRYAIVRNGCRYEHLEVLDRGRFEDSTKK